MVDMIINDPVGAANAIYVFITTLVGCIIGAVFAVVKLVQLFKKGKIRDVLSLIPTFIEEAEQFATADGKTKREIALSKVRTYCADNGIKYDEESAVLEIERYINYSKSVNAREKDVRNEDTADTDEII